MSGIRFNTILHTNDSHSVAEGTVELDSPRFPVTLTARDTLASGVYSKEPATKLEDSLTGILPITQAHNVMLDVTARAFQG